MPRSWNLKRFLHLDTKLPNVKQNEPIKSENTAAVVNAENKVKKKRKAPDVPVKLEPKYTATDSDGALKETFTAPLNHFGHSTESLTSSSTDYSTSSRSFTLSSMSGSAELMNNDENVFTKSEPGDVNHEPVLFRETQKDFQINDPNVISDVGAYVEKALIVSSNTNLNLSYPENSTGDLNNISQSHHPPRLASFESSTMLHQKGLAETTSAPSSLNSCLNAHYVTLDYVMSAAADNRQRSNDNNEVSGSSSPSSSFILAVDSEQESTTGSDVVDLNNKATTGIDIKASPVKTPEIKTGDIETDLFPLIFPGHNRLKETTAESQLSGFDSDIAKTASGNYDSQSLNADRLSSYFRNSDRCPEFDNNQERTNFENSEITSESNKIMSSHNETFTLKKWRDIDQCERCSGIVINLDQTMDEEVIRAKKMFGRCSCGPMDEQETVTEMDYCSCNLEEIPVDVKDYKNSLVKLSLESNTITELTQEIFSCSNLEYLSVSDNDITSLPAAVARLSKLIHLDISKNVIEAIPDCVRCLKNLEVFDTSVNPIEKLSEGFTQLVSLREAYMNDCFFEFLPANFGRMTQLQTVELRDNQLQILPKSMRRLSNLTCLDLGGNIFQELPDVIYKLTNLEQLWLDCNELSNVSVQLGNLTQLTYLDLSRNFLESIPNQVGSLEHLTDLIVAENTLMSLPDSIGFLRRLRFLSLESNQIKTLPQSFGKLRSLEEVDLCHNKIEALPGSVGKLRKLATLLLDDNLLSEIPVELGCCSELSVLQLSRNLINEIPRTIGDLANLKVFNICQNRIPHLPVTIKKLTNLEALWISPNQSKPIVPLQVQVDPSSSCEILTNVLFPQEENGHSRVMKVLGKTDESDETSYANDAADDDDLEAYARREHGKVKVVFDLDATTYSDDFDHLHAINDDVEFLNNSDNERSNDELLTDNFEQIEDKSQSFCDEIFNKESISKNVSTLNEYVNADNEKGDSKNMDTRDSSPAFVIDDSETKSASEPQSEDEDKKEGITLQSGGGLRAWSSRSNLPSALLKTKEWNPDEEPLISTDRDSPVEHRNMVNKVETPNRQPTSNSLKPLLESSSSSSVAIITTCSGSLLRAACASATQDSMNLNDIPFMDDAIEKKDCTLKEIALPVETKANQSLKNDVNFNERQAYVTHIKSESKNQFSKPFTSKIDKTNNLNKNDATDSKTSSSTASSDVLVTDHDSGVGNDVESQESIPDTHEEASIHNNCTLKVSESIPDGRSKSLVSVDAPSVRRNNGWIALVGTERLPKASQASVQKQAFDVNITSIATSQLILNGKKSAQKPHFILPSTIDCTTVTYSHDYNKAKTRSRNLGSAPLSSSSNLVAYNIKKFENYSHSSIKEPTSSTNSRNQKPKEKQFLNSKSNFVTNGKNAIFTTTVCTTKPVAVATILPSTNRVFDSQPQPMRPSIDSESAKFSKKNAKNILSSRKPCTSAEVNTTPPTVQQVEKISFPAKDDGSVGGSFPTRRVSAHAKKSKFDEALAVTKHKHFRDILDRMAQEHSSNSISHQNQKLCEVSTSTLASLPRITSPVPQQHSFLFEQTSVEKTNLNEETKTSIQNRFRQRPSGLEKAYFHTQDSKKTTPSLKVSRDRPSSAIQSDARNSAIRASVRSSHKVTPPAINQEKSLEERLGQLFLDGKKDFAPCTSQHEEDFRNKISSTDTSVCQTRKSEKPLPYDWKQQLLLYLERKKLSSGSKSISQSLQSQSKTVPSHPRDAKRNQQLKNKISSIKASENLMATTKNVQKQHPITSSKSQPSDYFVRPSFAHSKLSSRRSSARHQRTRTPGPEVTSSKVQQPEVAVRPRSAMDLPTKSFTDFDTYSNKTLNKEITKKERDPSSIPNRAPPSYEDHMLRRAHTVAAVCDKQEYHDYVNVEYLNELRLSGWSSGKATANQHLNYPLRSTGSHDSVLNAKDRLQNDVGRSRFAAMKGSISHSSISHNQQSSNHPRDHHHNGSFYPRHEAQPLHERHEQPFRQGGFSSQTEEVFGRNNDFGKIPAPPRTVKHSSKSESVQRHSKKPHNSPGYYTNHPPSATFSSTPASYIDVYGKHVSPLPIDGERAQNDQKDESVASAFQPYHPTHQPPLGRRDVLDTEPHRVYQSSFYQQASQQKSNYVKTHLCNPYPHHPVAHHHLDHRNGFSAKSNQYWRGAADPGAEVVTVTLRKNPTFGFHIMGGVDVGGNPYRPDDDGVFITYVSPGGAADGLVQPGDKILLVNGSDFIGITHKRAVDLLRNAGSDAVLVIERLIGRAV